MREAGQIRVGETWIISLTQALHRLYKLAMWWYETRTLARPSQLLDVGWHESSVHYQREGMREIEKQGEREFRWAYVPSASENLSNAGEETYRERERERASASGVDL